MHSCTLQTKATARQAPLSSRADGTLCIVCTHPPGLHAGLLGHWLEALLGNQSLATRLHQGGSGHTHLAWQVQASALARQVAMAAAGCAPLHAGFPALLIQLGKVRRVQAR